MRQEVFVRFAQGQEFELPLTDHSPMAADQARRWLDDQFLANDCEPLRASGKVLTADKVLALAAAVGADRFAQAPEWAHDFARAVTAALGRPMVRVDVEAVAITF